ncbi:hypothetical protein F5887DRAFT_1076118 [Amanita rubescens]|nr:hypothetical protein F5887DRAFT_1076118 [Amanita rubescens]
MEPATTGDVRNMGEAILNRLDAVTMPAHISGSQNGPTPPQHHAATLPTTSSLPAEHVEDPAMPGVRIPDLAIGEWKKAIDQWHRGDPAAGFRQLKVWEPREYRGRTRKLMASKRRTRELIAMAYERCGSDDTSFLDAYPQATCTLSELADAIRKKYGLRRNSKNGAPSERDNRRRSLDHQRPQPETG